MQGEKAMQNDPKKSIQEINQEFAERALSPEARKIYDQRMAEERRLSQKKAILEQYKALQFESLDTLKANIIQIQELLAEGGITEVIAENIPKINQLLVSANETIANGLVPAKEVERLSKYFDTVELYMRELEQTKMRKKV
jgi:hypothetical protein